MTLAVKSLSLALTVVLMWTLTGCQQSSTPARPMTSAHTASNDAFVFTTDQRIGVVHGTTMVADLPRGLSANDASLHLTKDGRFIYSWKSEGTDATKTNSTIDVVDTTTLERRTIPCAAPCSTVALGGSLVGDIYTGDGIEDSPESTDVATVRAIDLASPKPEFRTLGRVHLASPHPAKSDVSAYAYFLDAQTGKYLFLDLAPEGFAGRRVWEQPLDLYLATLDGPTIALGRYGGYGFESDVRGSLSPDGQHAVLNTHPEPTGASSQCDYSPIDLIDTTSGQKTQIHPAPPADGPQSLDVGRARWASDDTLYASYRQWSCIDALKDPPPPAPDPWRYRDGNWSPIDSLGPAITAAPLGDGAWAVVKPGVTKHDDPFAPTNGPLFYVDAHGTSTFITNGVTAIAPIRLRGRSS